MKEINIKEYLKAIPPPPVVLVSTLFGEQSNLAPYGMNMPISFSPPMYAIGVGFTRDTYKNIDDNNEFVVGIPGPELLPKISVLAEEFPRTVDELEKAGLTRIESQKISPYSIAECQANLECETEWIQRAGDHFIIVGRVVHVIVSDRFFDEGITRKNVRPIYHVGAAQAEFAGIGKLITTAGEYIMTEY